VKSVPQTAPGRGKRQGNTATLARRKLTERGLGHIVSALAGAEGIVDIQKPPAGDLVPDGTVVRLVLR
jgi:hypothetical protein